MQALLLERSSNSDINNHEIQTRPSRSTTNSTSNFSELQQNLNNPNIIRHFSNETILLVFLMITLFFVNIYSIIKNQVLKTMNNVISRIWRKIISHPPKNYQSDKPKKNPTKNKFEINHCAICLNSIHYEVSVSCFHRFCGILLFFNDFFSFTFSYSTLHYELLELTKPFSIEMSYL